MYKSTMTLEFAQDMANGRWTDPKYKFQGIKVHTQEIDGVSRQFVSFYHQHEDYVNDPQYWPNEVCIPAETALDLVGFALRVIARSHEFTEGNR